MSKQGTDDKTRGHFLIDGRVQGVGFRFSTVERARRLGVTGWVRNRADGRVEVVAEGDNKDVAAFLDWCRQGPGTARVTAVDQSFSEYRGEFDSFRVAY